VGRLQTARLENFIRRWGSIKGPGSVLSETLGDVFPTLDLENLTPESFLTAGWSLFARHATAIGVAAQNTGVQLIQPAARLSLVVVEKIVINSESDQFVTIGTNVALFSVVASTARRDTRNPQASFANAQIAASANATVAATGGILAAVGGVDREFEIPNGLAVLAPGTAFSVISATNNLNLTVSFFGRERQAEPSELSF